MRVVVIGAGLQGICAAYYLARAGAEAILGAYHKRQLRFIPREEAKQRAPEFLKWHVKRGFRAGAIA